MLMVAVVAAVVMLSYVHTCLLSLAFVICASCCTTYLNAYKTQEHVECIHC